MKLHLVIPIVNSFCIDENKKKGSYGNIRNTPLSIWRDASVSVFDLQADRLKNLHCGLRV